MTKLIHNNKTILPNMTYATNIFQISHGLMFASKTRIDKGICLVMPIPVDSRFSCSVTMLFCFYSYDILFVNSNCVVVDKQTLYPFKLSYIPKAKCRYVIESTKNKFKHIKIGDRIEIEK